MVQRGSEQGRVDPIVSCATQVKVIYFDSRQFRLSNTAVGVFAGIVQSMAASTKFSEETENQAEKF